MWWLSLSDGTAAIVEATSLPHTHVLAAIQELGRVSEFVDGLQLSPDFVIPGDCVGRLLSRADALRLYDQLVIGRRREKRRLDGNKAGNW